MGGLKAYFEDQLMKKLLGALWNDRTATLPSPIDQETIDRYISEIEREMDAALPTKNKVKKAVKKFGKEKFGYDEAGKRTFENALKFEQYKKNRHAMLKIAEDEVRRMLSYREAMKAIPFKDEAGRALLEALPNRWVRSLMKTDGTAESKSFNMEAVALLALGKGIMTADEFVEMRTGYYRTVKNMTQEEAEKAAKEENLNAPERLLKMWDNAVSDAKQKLNPAQMEDDAYGIVTGDRGVQDTLQKKMANFWNPGLYLMWNTKDTLENDLGKMIGFNMTKDEIQNRIRENENYTGILQRYQIEMQKSANPYFTVLDSYKTSADTQGSDMPWAHDDRRPKTLSQELYLSFLDSPENYPALSMDLFKSKREEYAFMEEHIVKEEPSDFEFVVYHNPQNGYTTINRMKHMEDRKIVSRDDEISPEECIQKYVNKNLAPERDEFIRAFGQWDKKHRTSDEFERMRRAMEALNGVQVSENPTIVELATIKGLYRELQAATDAYLEKKEADKARNHNRYTGRYEKKRVEFAQKLKKFADFRFERISYAKGYKDTLELRQIKERELAANAEWKENPKYRELNALQYLEAKRQEVIEKQRIAREELEREEKEKRKVEEDKKLKNYGKELKEKIDPLKSNINEPNQDTDSALVKIEKYIKDHSDRRTEVMATDLNQAVEESRLALAGTTVKCMVEWEKNRERNTAPATFTVTEFINAGKIDDLVKIVRAQPKFKQFVSLECNLIKNNWFKDKTTTPSAAWAIACEMMDGMKLAEKDAKIQNENNVDNEIQVQDRNSQAKNEENNGNAVDNKVSDLNKDSQAKNEENTDDKNQAQQIKIAMKFNELESMGKKIEEVKSVNKTRNSIAVNKTKTLEDIQPQKEK